MTMKRNGPPPDTRGVVGSARGYAVTGKQRGVGNTRKENNLVAANASRKRK